MLVHKPKAKCREAGFSLIEMMVVVVIILIISAMAIPSVTRAIAIARLRSQASSVASILDRARQQAVRTNSPVTVYADFGANSGRIFADLPGGTAAVYDVGEPSFALAPPVSFTATSPGAAPSVPGSLQSVSSYSNSAVTAIARFNQLGLPCVVDTSLGLPSAVSYCRSYATSGGGSLTAYVIYITDGSGRYAAIAVAGTERVRTYLWDGVKFEGT